MGAFKSLTSQDVVITPFVVNKSFSFAGSASLKADNVFIERLIGTNVTGAFEIASEPTTGTTSSSGYSSSYYQRDIYNSVKQLYYTNELPNPEGTYIVTDSQGNIIESNVNTNVHSRFDNYLESTLYYVSQSRYFPTASNAQVAVLSIPSQLYGDYINPRSFTLGFSDSPDFLVYTDDGEGYLTEETIGNSRGIINYSHGIIVLIGTFNNINNFAMDNDLTVAFQSSRTIYETQYKCTIRENEFNYSLNPSLISGSNFTNPLNSSCSIDIRGQVYDFVTGSNWAPYVTTVGLYNETNDLLAVAKLSQPLPTSRTTDMSIIVNLDK
jgi:hypothetical protein